MQKKKALVLLIREILDQVDEAASIAGRQGDTQRAQLILTEMCSVLKDLDPEMIALYFDVLPTLAAAVKPRRDPVYSEDSAKLAQKVKHEFVEWVREELAIKA